MQATSDFREDDAEVIRLLCYTRVKLRQERVLQRANVVRIGRLRGPPDAVVGGALSSWPSMIDDESTMNGRRTDDKRRIDDELTTNG